MPSTRSRRTPAAAAAAEEPAVQTSGVTPTPRTAAGKTTRGTPSGRGKQPAKPSTGTVKGKGPATVAKALEQRTAFLGPGVLAPEEQEAIAAVSAQQKIDELRRKNRRAFAEAAAEAARMGAEGALLDGFSVQGYDDDGRITTSRVAQPPLPVGVGELIEAVPGVPDAQMERSKNLVSQWNAVFTPSTTPERAITMILLENQAVAFANGELFMPPPLSVEGLALPALMTTEGDVNVQQEVLGIIGRGRQNLEDRIAALLLQGEQCAAMGLAWNYSRLGDVTRTLLEGAFFSGYMPTRVLDILAPIIRQGGFLAAFNNPAGWLISEIGGFMTAEAINTYLLIWLTNKLYGAKLFAEYSGSADEAVEVQEITDRFHEVLQAPDFAGQLRVIGDEIIKIWNRSAAAFTLASGAVFKLPELAVGAATGVAEAAAATAMDWPYKVLQTAAREVNNQTELLKERRQLALGVSRTWRDAPGEAGLAVAGPVPPPGLTSLAKELQKAMLRGVRDFLQSTLVLVRVREAQPEDLIVQINKSMASTIVDLYMLGRRSLGLRPYDGFAPQLKEVGSLISDPVYKDEVEEHIRATAEAIASQEEYGDDMFNPRCSLADGLGPAFAFGDDGSQNSENVDSQNVEDEDLTPWQSLVRGWARILKGRTQGGARKRKHHSTRSSKGSKTGKRSTRKHGKAKSKRAKKSGAKTRHMRLPPGAGRRTRKHRK